MKKIEKISAVLKAPYGVFVNVKEAHDLMVSAMKEVRALSQKAGINFCDRIKIKSKGMC